jgi:glycerate kinase
MRFAESCLRRLAAVLEDQCGLDPAAIPGAGAAGGLGFGLMAFAGAKPVPGFEVFAAAARLEAQIRRADVVITGEGAVDRQTFMGKGVGRVAELCRKLKVPCLAVAGSMGEPREAARVFAASAALTELATLENARRRPGHYLAEASAWLAADPLGPICARRPAQPSPRRTPC